LGVYELGDGSNENENENENENQNGNQNLGEISWRFLELGGFGYFTKRRKPKITPNLWVIAVTLILGLSKNL
jgi:hypothetical protein